MIKLKRSIDHAIKTKAIIHLASHPHDFSNKESIDFLESVLSYVHEKKLKGDLEARTMQEIWKKYLKSEKGDV